MREMTSQQLCWSRWLLDVAIASVLQRASKVGPVRTGDGDHNLGPERLPGPTPQSHHRASESLSDFTMP